MSSTTTSGPASGGLAPPALADALAEAGRRLDATPPLVPIRSHHYLPSEPAVEGNPVLSVRQTDIACVGRDLPSYLMGLFGPEPKARRVGGRTRRPLLDGGGTHESRPRARTWRGRS